jgi:putative ABC transport system substrate-binding protein
VIPIVFATAGDPVGSGIVASLARPGGNITGLSAQELVPAFDEFKGRAQVLYVIPSPLIFANRTRISILAVAARLATMHLLREYVEAGGLMAYGPNWPHIWRRAADLVDKILRGAKPADIPVEQPTKFDLIINLTTAKALGLTVPDRLLAIADDLVE